MPVPREPGDGGQADISRGLIKLYRDSYGKGPSTAHSYLLDGGVACVLEGGFTTVERTLIGAGDPEPVHHIRRAFQDAMEAEFVRIVEQATKREVIISMSQVHSDPDLDVELFLLAPVPDLDDSAGSNQAAQGPAMGQISTRLVQLHRHYFGQGPTKAKTYLAGDTVFSILRDGLTTVEKTLIENGDSSSVRAMRRRFQEVMGDQFRRVVEDATGRVVIAYMSQVHTNPAAAMEVFVLEPDAGQGQDAD